MAEDRFEHVALNLYAVTDDATSNDGMMRQAYKQKFVALDIGVTPPQTAAAHDLYEALRPIVVAATGLEASLRQARTHKERVQQLYFLAYAMATVAKLNHVNFSLAHGLPVAAQGLDVDLSTACEEFLRAFDGIRANGKAVFTKLDANFCGVSDEGVNQLDVMGGQFQSFDGTALTIWHYVAEDTKLRDAYKAWAVHVKDVVRRQPGMLTVLAGEQQFVHEVIAEALALAALAKPTHAPMWNVFDQVIAQLAAQIQSQTVFDDAQALTKWMKAEGKTLSEGAVGTISMATLGIGADSLFLKIAQLGIARETSKALDGTAHSIVSAETLAKYFGGAEAEILKAFREARAAQAKVGTSPSKEDPEAVKEFREATHKMRETLGEKSGLDGKFANKVLAVLNALLVFDSIQSLNSATTGWDEIKATADLGVAASSVAGSSVNVLKYAKIVTFADSSLVVLKFAPVLAAISGLAQIMADPGPGGEKKVSDIVVGVLNCASGAFMSAAWGIEVAGTDLLAESLLAAWVPVAGQVLGVVAFAITIVVAVREAATPIMQTYFENIISSLNNNHATDLQRMSLAEKVKAIEEVVKKGGFRQVAVVYSAAEGRREQRERLVKTLSRWVGVEGAEKMVEP